MEKEEETKKKKMTGRKEMTMLSPLID